MKRVVRIVLVELMHKPKTTLEEARIAVSAAYRSLKGFQDQTDASLLVKDEILEEDPRLVPFLFDVYILSCAVCLATLTRLISKP